MPDACPVARPTEIQQCIGTIAFGKVVGGHSADVYVAKMPQSTARQQRMCTATSALAERTTLLAPRVANTCTWAVIDFVERNAVSQQYLRKSNKCAAAFEALVLTQSPSLGGKCLNMWLCAEKLRSEGGQKICPSGKKDAGSTQFFSTVCTGCKPMLIGLPARIPINTHSTRQNTHWRDVCRAQCQTRSTYVRRHHHVGAHRYSIARIRGSAKGSSRGLDHCRTKTTCSDRPRKAAGTRTVIVDGTFAKQKHWIRKTVITGTRTVHGG